MAPPTKWGIGLKLAGLRLSGIAAVEGGVAAAFRREIEAADDPKAKRPDRERLALSSPFRTLKLWVEDASTPAKLAATWRVSSKHTSSFA